MEAAGGRAVGYEANGGFLLGFAATGPAGPLPPLMTRDALLPLIAPLVRARSQGLGLAALVAGEPPRFTAADRLRDVPTDLGQTLVARLDTDADARAAFLAPFGMESIVDRTDGLRITLEGGQIVHLRPSGNAPELRFYAEAESQSAADVLLARGLTALAQSLT
jgi:phosphomannomutase